MHSKQPNHIAFCGPQGAGKTRAANYLTQRGFEKISFAKPIKDMLLALGVPEANLTGDQKLKDEPLSRFGGRSARYLMQTLGTEWGRGLVNPTVWGDYTMRELARKQMFKIVYTVCDDLRFQTEALALKKKGAVIVRIIGRRSAEADEFHSSEHYYSQMVPDYEIVNNGTLDNLFEQLNDLMVGKLPRFEGSPQEA